MNSLKNLFDLDQTKAHVLILCGDQQLIESHILSHFQFNFDIRILRTTYGRCQTIDGVFQEFAAALQFGSYFGWNWDALDECFYDFNEVDRMHHVLLWTHANRILERATERDFEIFISCFDFYRRESTLFNIIILHVDPENRDFFVARVKCYFPTIEVFDFSEN